MPRNRRRYYNEIAASSRLRLDAISDGIFGVAMTLLVLTLVVPTAMEVHDAGNLWHALLELMPYVVTYFMSFLTLGIFWVAQETQSSEVERTDRDYTWIMLAFLLFVTLVPFSTALLAAYYQSWMAVVEYWFNIFLLGAVNGCRRVCRSNRPLLCGEASDTAAGNPSPCRNRTIALRNRHGTVHLRHPNQHRCDRANSAQLRLGPEAAIPSPFISGQLTLLRVACRR